MQWIFVIVAFNCVLFLALDFFRWLSNHHKGGGLWNG